MAENILQQHMKGNTQASIESKLNPKELAFNETLLQAVYKHLNGVTIDTLPFASKLALTLLGSSGGLGIGIYSAAHVILSSTNSQDLWDEVDALLAAQSVAGLMNLTTAQSASGIKTFSDGVVMAAAAVLAAQKVTVAKELVVNTGSLEYPTGDTNITNARANQANVSGVSNVTVIAASANIYFSFAGLLDGQMLYVYNEGGVTAKIDTNPGSGVGAAISELPGQSGATYRFHLGSSETEKLKNYSQLVVGT